MAQPIVPVVTQRSAIADPMRPVYQDAGSVPLDAFQRGTGLARVGDAVMQVSADVMDASRKLQEEDDKRELKKLTIEYDSAARVLGHGDGTENNKGFFSTQGENAISSFNPTVAALQAKKQDILGMASNGRVKKAFELIAAEREGQEKTRYLDHLSRERIKANDAVSDARMDNALEESAANYKDKDVLAGSLSIIEKEMKEKAVRNGWSEDVLKNKTREAQSKTIGASVMAALENDAMLAREIYNTNKDKIDGTVRIKLEKALEVEGLRQQSQLETERIMGRGLDYSAALAEARKIKDPKLQDETVTRIEKRFHEQQFAIAIQDRANRKEIWDLHDKGVTLDQMPSRLRSSMDGTLYAAVQRAELDKLKGGSGYGKVDNPDIINKLHDMARNDDKMPFIQTDLNEFRGELTKETYEKWQGIQRNYDGKDEKAKAKQASYGLADKVIGDLLPTAIKTSGKTASQLDRQRAADITKFAYDYVEEMHRQGKTFTTEDIRKAIAPQIIRVKMENETWLGRVFGTDTRMLAYEVANKGRKSVIADFDSQVSNIATATGLKPIVLEQSKKILDKNSMPITIENLGYGAVSVATNVPVSRIKSLQEELIKNKQPVTLENIQELYNRQGNK